jgi:phosphomannomutase
MLNDFYKQFKSGTDIRGVAVEGVEGQSVNLTNEVVADMADGFVLWLSKKAGKPADELKISVGRDSRIQAPILWKL